MKKQITDIRYLDPSTKKPMQGHLVIEEGKIRGFTLERLQDVQSVIDGGGLWLFPGLVDLHVHFRDPGEEGKETISTGSQAALAGGYTTVVCMPNTHPALDHHEILAQQVRKASSQSCRVLFMGAVTRGLAGKERVPVKEYGLREVVGVTEDGKPISSARIMLETMEEAAAAGLMVADHCEDPTLMFDRSVNRGPVAEELGVVGVPALAEELMVQRNLHLAAWSGCPVHLQHISSVGSVRLIRQAKRSGVPVTAEVTPHHLCLTEQAVLHRGAMAKMSPPLRSETDRRALIEGLVDGTLDCIATDHAPHERSVKTGSFVQAANGVIGLETAFSAVLTYLWKTGNCPLHRIVDSLSNRPASLLGMAHLGNLQPGAEADLLLADLDAVWQVDVDAFHSRSQNTPFADEELQGRVVKTLRAGEVCFSLR